jgi:hypothetical protein
MGIICLHAVITRTTRRSYKDFLSRPEREAELKANDPDTKKTDD